MRLGITGEMDLINYQWLSLMLATTRHGWYAPGHSSCRRSRIERRGAAASPGCRRSVGAFRRSPIPGERVHIVAAGPGVDVFEQALASGVVCIILDLKLRGFDSFEMCRRLKAEARRGTN